MSHSTFHITFWSNQELMHMIIDLKNPFDFQKQNWGVIIQKVLILNDCHLWLCFPLRLWDFKSIISIFWYINCKSQLGNSPWVLRSGNDLLDQWFSICGPRIGSYSKLGKVFEMQILGPHTRLTESETEIRSRGRDRNLRFNTPKTGAIQANPSWKTSLLD